MAEAPEPIEQRLAAAVGSLNLATAAVVASLAEALSTGAWAPRTLILAAPGRPLGARSRPRRDHARGRRPSDA